MENFWQYLWPHSELWVQQSLPEFWQYHIIFSFYNWFIIYWWALLVNWKLLATFNATLWVLESEWTPNNHILFLEYFLLVLNLKKKFLNFTLLGEFCWHRAHTRYENWICWRQIAIWSCLWWLLCHALQTEADIGWKLKFKKVEVWQKYNMPSLSLI